MVALARHYYPFLPVNPLLKDRYESHLRVPRLEVPVLALVAEHDEVIPAKISSGLIAAFSPDTVEKVVIEGAGHNTIQEYEKYYQSITNFTNKILADRAR